MPRILKQMGALMARAVRLWWGSATVGEGVGMLTVSLGVRARKLVLQPSKGHMVQGKNGLRKHRYGHMQESWAPGREKGLCWTLVIMPTPQIGFGFEFLLPGSQKQKVRIKIRTWANEASNWQKQKSATSAESSLGPGCKASHKYVLPISILHWVCTFKIIITK